MCGIAGLWSPASNVEGNLLATVGRMVDTIAQRGPDEVGTWSDIDSAFALGHRRLSIVDLSPAGHQPMHSSSGRYVIAFNGEIYNHLQLRTELDGAGLAPAWRGHSDTETLLAAVEHWGVEATLNRTVGMFAVALWDKLERTLYLVRDRFGEKPLYYGWAGGAFVFGSELKALRAYPGFTNQVCPLALAKYLRFTFVPAPRSIYVGIYKLEPGCLLIIRGRPPALAPGEPLCPPAIFHSLTVRRWWSLGSVVEAGAQALISDEVEALQALNASLKESVKIQSLADVPLGAFLSGGVDSSTIVALMQQQASRPVKTFTVGFEEAGFDESPHARAVADHLGTEHYEVFVTASEARSVIPQLPTMYDEPFADSSQISTHMLCRAARQQVTVALSGDAGDELFGGYNRYFWGPRVWDRVSWLPYRLRQAFASRLCAVAPAKWDWLLRCTGMPQPGQKLHKLGSALKRAHSIDDLYRNLISGWPEPRALVLGINGMPGGGVAASVMLPDLPAGSVNDARSRMMFWDAVTYLPDDILCKVDRAAMAISLETRAPFLDHRVAELAWRLPLTMKIRGGKGKWALRQILYRHVPRQLIERPKAGFAVPVGQWLRGPLRTWAEDLLNEDRLRREGYLKPDPIREAWTQHLSGRSDWTQKLWAVLMFQAWLESISAPKSHRRAA
jgi:asparagine synthase (glutamine-hydrolysing)